MEKIRDNAKILAEIARLFPNDTPNGVYNTLEMPVIDRNNAMWFAQAEGLIEEHKPGDTKSIKAISDEPLFHVEVEKTKQSIQYTMEKLAESEEDIHEAQLFEWMAGYPTHLVVIAIKQMVADKELHQYTLTDVSVITDKKLAKKLEIKVGEEQKSPYVFFSLPENAGKNWGLKQFPDQSKVEVE